MLSDYFLWGISGIVCFSLGGRRVSYFLNYKTGGRPRACPPFSWELGVRIENVIFRAKPRG